MRRLAVSLITLFMIAILPAPALAYEEVFSTQGYEWVTMRGHGMYIKKVSRRQLLYTLREQEESRTLSYEL